MRLFQRKRLFVDRRVQGAFLLRIFYYWLFGLLAMSELVLCWDILRGPDAPFFELFRFDILWTEHLPIVIASVIILAVVLIDVTGLTNRMAGPLFRIRASMRKLAAGERVEPLQFREKDFWLEIANEFNALSAYVERLKQEAAATRSHEVIVTLPEHDFEPAATH